MLLLRRDRLLCAPPCPLYRENEKSRRRPFFRALCHRCDRLVLPRSRFIRHRDYGNYVYSSCGAQGYLCLDPEAPSDCGTETHSPTPSPAAASGYPGCEWPLYFIGDGFCDTSTNNAECGWDGGKHGGTLFSLDAQRAWLGAQSRVRI